MLDIDQIDSELLLNRGFYSTVRAAHEDSLKKMQIQCSNLSSAATSILKRIQGKEDEEVESVAELIKQGRVMLDAIEKSADEVSSLAKQRAEMKSKAWPKY